MRKEQKNSRNVHIQVIQIRPKTMRMWTNPNIDKQESAIYWQEIHKIGEFRKEREKTMNNVNNMKNNKILS